MKFRPILVFVAMLCAVMAAPVLASAQTIQSEAEFQRYLANHPKLQANPSLMSDPAYLAKHPNLALFLHDHPGIHNQARAMGAYDSSHQWRDSNWWYRHNPNWVHSNHPEWFNSHPDWYAAHPEWRTAAVAPAPVVEHNRVIVDPHGREIQQHTYTNTHVYEQNNKEHH